MSKDEAIEMFKNYKNKVGNQLNMKIKVIKNDRGGEYESPFGEFCFQNGIIHQTTTLYPP
jgi:hypothetical protein